MKREENGDIKDYLACVKSVDDNIGRVLDYLKENNLEENTIIVVTSDQGFYLGDHGFFDKRFIYEESLRMPFMVKYSGKIKAGSVNEDIITNIDFAPTLLELAGISTTQKMHVIGESARRANFSLYGYHKKTNPLLSKLNNLYAYPANSSATYTTAGVKSILDHKKSRNFYEILPNYLYRNGIDVIWRTTNWGEPNINIKNYINKQDLGKICLNKSSGYDEILLCGLKERIQNSGSNKMFIVLHTSTSHGPTYSKKYPKQFNQFLPICESVELSKCTQEELINAYDNTILYTDYILSEVIKDLSQLKGYNSTMLFVSDHGESLGEKNLYMHGFPMSIAPKEQFEIPFIVWTSNDSVILKENKSLSQYHVFHSVLDFLAIESPVYDATMSIFK